MDVKLNTEIDIKMEPPTYDKKFDVPNTSITNSIKTKKKNTSINLAKHFQRSTHGSKTKQKSDKINPEIKGKNNEINKITEVKSDNNKLPINLPISIPFVIEYSKPLNFDHGYEKPMMLFTLSLTPVSKKTFDDLKQQSVVDEPKNYSTVIKKKIFKPGPKSKTKDAEYEKYESLIKTLEFIVSEKEEIIFNTEKFMIRAHKENPQFCNDKKLKYKSENILPFKPFVSVQCLERTVIIFWFITEKLKSDETQIKTYKLYLCRLKENSNSNKSNWKKVGNFKADLLPTGCKIHLLPKGYTYYFKLKAMDVNHQETPCVHFHANM